MKTEDFTKWLYMLFAEAFGVAETPSGYFLDTGRAGLLGTLDEISAELASATLKPGNATIAGHCGHMLYHLELFAAYGRGERPAPDWPGSWHTSVVDDDEWNALRTALRNTYTAIVEHLQGLETWDEAPIAASMILLAHTAYHTGEIRQQLTALTR